MMKRIPFSTGLPKFLLFLSLGFVPALVEACPRCVDATPYKTGMQIAVAVLLPIPFVLAYGLYRWIQNESKVDSPEI
jgi:hypothetical protein